MKSTNGKTMKTLATGLVLVGVAVLSLGSTGCRKMIKEKEAARILETGEFDADALRSIAAEQAANGKIAINHNETFVVMA
jgi:hypothetical protein